jgi:hypothetical protein
MRLWGIGRKIDSPGVQENAKERFRDEKFSRKYCCAVRRPDAAGPEFHYLREV